MNIFSSLYQNLTAQIREINARYSKPGIHVTPMVRICLLILRFYLFLLIGLLVYKFITVVRQ